MNVKHTYITDTSNINVGIKRAKRIVETSIKENNISKPLGYIEYQLLKNEFIEGLDLNKEEKLKRVYLVSQFLEYCKTKEKQIK